jgi:hypothetical protein
MDVALELKQIDEVVSTEYRAILVMTDGGEITLAGNADAQMRLIAKWIRAIAEEVDVSNQDILSVLALHLGGELEVLPRPVPEGY